MKALHSLSRFSITLIASLVLVACGGGGSENGMVIEGTLIQGEGSGHVNSALRHGSGEPIELVSVCALGECSITDDDGHWGFAADESFTGGQVAFAINGHGIDTQLVVDVPQASSVVVKFTRHTGNDLSATVAEVDGVAVEHHEH